MKICTYCGKPWDDGKHEEISSGTTKVYACPQHPDDGGWTLLSATVPPYVEVPG